MRRWTRSTLTSKRLIRAALGNCSKHLRRIISTKTVKLIACYCSPWLCRSTTVVIATESTAPFHHGYSRRRAIRLTDPNLVTAETEAFAGDHQTATRRNPGRLVVSATRADFTTYSPIARWRQIAVPLTGTPQEVCALTSVAITRLVVEAPFTCDDILERRLLGSAVAS